MKKPDIQFYNVSERTYVIQFYSIPELDPDPLRQKVRIQTDPDPQHWKYETRFSKDFQKVPYRTVPYRTVRTVISR